VSLAATQLSYAYPGPRGARHATLHEVTVRIPAGSRTGVLGPNGCGKTTLLKLLAGVLRPDRGSVSLDDRPLASLSRREAARRMALVPQQTHPVFDYTVLELVLMGRHPHLGAFTLEGPRDLAIAREALAATGAAHLAGRLYASLSGGEQQRVVIAAALAQEPSILLLDEPTTALDLRAQVEVTALLAGLARDRRVTLVIATHDLNLAAALCDRLVVLRDGRLLAEGPTADLLTAPLVHRLYGIDADVRFHERAGHLTVVPLPQAGVS
jgi:iron complex transport system ATP-binding protein